MSAPETGSKAIGWPAARGGPPTVAELVRKGFIRLHERIDVARSRHKPLSLLRQEAKRHLEQMLDSDGGHLSRGDRERVLEDVLACSLGFSPLEELFRDETKREILTLAWNQVIALTGEQWMPTSTRFRDSEQYTEFVLRLAELGTNAGTGPDVGGAFDVLLPNGFRAIAVLPPGVMGQPPLVLLARGETPPLPTPSSKSAVNSFPSARPTIPPATRSGVVPAPSVRAIPAPAPSQEPLSEPPATVLVSRLTAELGTRPANAPAPTVYDPLSRLRARVTERLIARCAAVGMYDMSQIPVAELRRILAVHIVEVAATERVKLDESEQDRIALQILAGMNR